jgi:outer membrane protein assembly factor BamA
VFPVPVLGSSPETGLMFGVAVVGVSSPDGSGAATRPSTALFTAIYTVKHQYQLALEADGWTRGDRWHWTGGVGFQRFPGQYHGLGAAATDTSETYTPVALTFSAGAQRRLGGGVYVGAAYAFRHTRMVETEAGGRLAPGAVPGSRGGAEAALTVEGLWDSRDALYRTQRGGYARVAVGVAGSALGSDFAYRRLTADARAYRSVGHGIVLAGQAIVDATDGTVPFERLPRLGGQNVLRGYTEPRFRDGAMGAVQAEVRAPLRGILALVLFGGTGTTAPKLGSIGDGAWRVAGGAGLRVLLDRAAGLQLRIDYAVAKGGGGLYIAAGDAF